MSKTLEEILNKTDYQTVNEAYDDVQDYARQQGFAVIKRHSNQRACTFECCHTGSKQNYNNKNGNKKRYSNLKKIYTFLFSKRKIIFTPIKLKFLLFIDATKKADIVHRTYQDKNGLTKKFPNRTSRKSNCTWKIIISSTKANNHKWKFTTKLHDIPEHSHGMSTMPLVYHEHRVKDAQERRNIVSQLEAGISPRQIMKQERINLPSPVVATPNPQSLNIQLPVPSFPPTPTIRPTYITEPMTPTQQSILTSFYNVVPKDLYNLGQKIRANENKRGNYQEMDLIMIFLQQAGYISRYDTDSTRKIIKSIFATHGTCIEKARRFPDVIVIDCTYRSN